MNVDSRNGREDFSLEWMEQRLRGLAGVEPPGKLKERLLAAAPRQSAGEALRRHVRRWPGATGWASVAAMIMAFCGVIWLRMPAGPSARSSPDANNSLGQVLAADYNSVHPPDINAVDSNGLY